MTRYFNYTFKHYFDEITVSKQVTDNMEERNGHKAGYAARYFNDFLRTYAGYKKSVVTASRIQEVTKKEMVSKKETLSNIEKAHDRFIAELENGTYEWGR